VETDRPRRFEENDSAAVVTGGRCRRRGSCFSFFNAFCSVIPSLCATRNRVTCNNYSYMHSIDAEDGISIYSYFYLKKAAAYCIGLKICMEWQIIIK
jgi:hypothetical protein